jgi:hypothetical protein
MKAIIFLDVVDSIAFKRAQIQRSTLHGESEANAIIRQRLDVAIELLRKADPELMQSPAEGDGVVVFGKKLPELFKALARHQNDWKGWPEGPVLRATIGHGDYEGMDDGPEVPKRGKEIDLAHRLLKLTPMGGLVVTESAGVALKAAGYDDKLVMRVVSVAGFDTDQVCWEADHYWLPPLNTLQPVGEPQSKTVVIERRQPGKQHAPVVVVNTASDHFWKFFAACALILTVSLLVAFLIIYLRGNPHVLAYYFGRW